MIDLPRCCDHRGLNFPDGRRCPRHQSPEDRKLIADLDRRAKPILGTHGWPYGPNIDVQARIRMLDWAVRYGLKRANTHCMGLHWLRKGRCGVIGCQPDSSWMDHVTRWSRAGQPGVLLTQPYGLTDEAFVKLGALAADDTLTVLSRGEGWYGHGTVAVEVWRASAYDAFVEAGRPGAT